MFVWDNYQAEGITFTLVRKTKHQRTQQQRTCLFCVTHMGWAHILPCGGEDSHTGASQFHQA